MTPTIINIIFLIIFFFITSFFLLFFNLLIHKKKFFDREKMTSFECGFDMMSNPRIPFSMHFFLISLMFLIFDIEITLLIPLIIQLKTTNNSLILSLMFFMMILIFSIYIEYSENMIEWKL